MKNIKKTLKSLRHKLRLLLTYRRSKRLTSQLKGILQILSDIPVIVISYNNGVYTRNICEQLNKLGIKPIVIDNNSKDKKTLTILASLKNSNKSYVVYSNYNFGHEVGFIEPVYKLLPDVFAYTDPDLQFNEKLPKNFLTILSQLTIDYSVFKAGFSLTLDIDEEIKDTTFYSCHHKPIFFERTLTIRQFEEKYWTKPLQHKKLKVYAAPIDTTFAVYRKQNYTGDFHSAVRVAGNFSAIHLPWFKNLDILSADDKVVYQKNNRSSNW